MASQDPEPTLQNWLTAAGQRQILTALSPFPLTADPRQNRQQAPSYHCLRGAVNFFSKRDWADLNRRPSA